MHNGGDGEQQEKPEPGVLARILGGSQASPAMTATKAIVAIKKKAMESQWLEKNCADGLVEVLFPKAGITGTLAPGAVYPRL